MKYWKKKDNDEVVAWGCCSAFEKIDPDCVEITEQEYLALVSAQMEKEEQDRIDYEKYLDLITFYADQIKTGVITIDDVPAEYQEAVADFIKPSVEDRISSLEATVAEATNYEAIIHEVANA